MNYTATLYHRERKEQARILVDEVHYTDVGEFWIYLQGIDLHGTRAGLKSRRRRDAGSRRTSPCTSHPTAPVDVLNVASKELRDRGVVPTW